MPSGVYTAGKSRIGAGLNWRTAPLRVLLVTPAYVFDASHSTVAGIESYELEDYERQDLEVRGVVTDVGAEVCRLTAGPSTFAAVTGTVQGAVVYIRGGADDGTPGDDALLSYYEFVVPAVAGGDNLVVRWDSAGVLVLT